MINFNFFAKKKTPIVIDKDPTASGRGNFWSIDGKDYNQDEISIETYRKIANHYQISAALAVISYSLQQINWYIESDDEQVKKVVTKGIDNIWNKLIMGISKSFRFGFSPMIKVFKIEKIDGKDYIVFKKIKDLAPERCVVNVDEKDGTFKGFFYNKGTLSNQAIHPDYCFWHVNMMEDGNFYGNSMLKKVYKPWFYSEKIHMFSNRYYERFGEPLVIGRSPKKVTVQNNKGEESDAQSVMDSIIANIRSHSSVNLASERDEEGNYMFDLQYLESTMRGFDFNSYLDRLDTECSTGLLLPGLVLSAKGSGSYSLGSTQMEVFYTNLMGIMNEISDNIDKYLIKQLVEYNFGKDKSAKFRYQPLSAEFKAKTVDIITALINKDFAHPDFEELSKRTGIKLVEIDASERQKIAPAVVKKEDPAKKATADKKEKALAEKERELSAFNEELEEKSELLNKKEAEIEEMIDDLEEIKNG